MGFTDTTAFKGILEKGIADTQQIEDANKAKAAELVANLLAVPLNRALTQLLEVEDLRKEQLNRKLITGVLNVVAGHLKNVNAAKKVEDADQSHLLKDGFYAEAKKVLELIFPNGKDDLTFLDPRFRDQVWTMTTDTLFNRVLPLSAEILLDENFLTSVIFSALKDKREDLLLELKSPPVNKPQATERKIDDLDRACGAMVAEAMELFKLPEMPLWSNFPKWLKAKIKSPEVQKHLGSKLRAKFNDDFMKRTVKSVFEKAASRDSKVKPAMMTTVEKNAQIKVLSQELVDLQVASLLKEKQEQLQAKVRALFPNWKRLSPGLRRACVAVVAFIFRAIVYALFQSGTYHLRPWIRNRLYRFIHLDENRDIVMNLLRKAPKGHSQVDGKVVLDEDLIFKFAKAFETAFE